MRYPRNEAQLTKTIVSAILREFPGAWQLKVHGGGYQRNGVPDLLLCIDGRFIGIEVKHRKPAETEEHILSRVTPVQWAEIARIKQAGGVAYVAWTVEYAISRLKQEIS